MTDPVECRACRAGLPLVWHVQSKKTMHLAQGLSVTSCARVDARERQARDIANGDPARSAPPRHRS